MNDYLYADEWQPIESAPRDGIVVHLKSEDGDDIGYFDTEWSTEYGNGKPSAWRPFMGGQARVAGR